VLLSGIFFAGKVAKLFTVTKQSDKSTNTLTYRVEGQIFFASAESFIHSFDFGSTHAFIIIDVSRAHLWDITAVGALDKVVLKLRSSGAQVEVRGFNRASADMIDKFALHDKAERQSASNSLH
jgi:SulP family sulfate permease